MRPLTELDSSLRRIGELVRRRSTSDRRMGKIWMLAPILPIIIGITLVLSVIRIVLSNFSNLQSLQGSETAIPAVAAILSLYFLGIVALYMILLIDSVSIYYLLDRRNNHFKRQQQLFAMLPRYLTACSTVPVENASRLAEMTEDGLTEEENRPAVIWAILNFLVSPIVSLIAAFSLTQDLRKHEDRQQNYQVILTTTLNQMSISLSPLPPWRLHKRDPFLFLILTAITGGLFWIYWFYKLLEDYNEHFQDQALFEDQVLASLKPKIPSKQCHSCGGPVPEEAKFCPFCGKSQQT